MVRSNSETPCPIPIDCNGYPLATDAAHVIKNDGPIRAKHHRLIFARAIKNERIGLTKEAIYFGTTLPTPN